MNGHKRVCQKLDCKKGGNEPEIAKGKRTRRILKAPGPGGKSCSPSGERSLEECDGECPGT